MRRFSFCQLVTITLLSCFMSALVSQCAAQTYTLTNLGTLGGPWSQARAINNAGEIVGLSSRVGAEFDLPTHAFLYKNGVMTDLGDFGGDAAWAYAINNQGQVAGFANDPNGSPQHAFVYENGTLTDIGSLPGMPNIYSVAYGINDSGTVVGESKGQALIYRDGQAVGLSRRGALFAYGVNNSNEIVGMLQSNHAFLFADNHMQDLGTLDGDLDNVSVAHSINDAGQVVGTSWTDGNSRQRAFLYENGSMIDLGALNGEVAAAYDINNQGDIVGESLGLAFLYRNGVMIDLNSLVVSYPGFFILE